MCECAHKLNYKCGTFTNGSHTGTYGRCSPQCIALLRRTSRMRPLQLNHTRDQMLHACVVGCISRSFHSPPHSSAAHHTYRTHTHTHKSLQMRVKQLQWQMCTTARVQHATCWQYTAALCGCLWYLQLLYAIAAQTGPPGERRLCIL